MLSSFLIRRIQTALRTVPEITAEVLEARLRKLPEHADEMRQVSSGEFRAEFDNARRVIRTNNRVQAAPVAISQTYWEEYDS